MAETIANMSKQEFTQIISNIVEQKIIEILGDSDEGFILKENVRKRLIKQRKAVAKGERGDDFEMVIKRISNR